MKTYTLRWWKSPFASVTITIEGTNLDHLRMFAWDEAKKKGWTPRKWYQWWRWFDTSSQTKGSDL